MNRFRELTSPLTPDAMVRDGSSYIDFLSAQPTFRSGPLHAAIIRGRVAANPRMDDR